jgi:hypothetical protein
VVVANKLIIDPAARERIRAALEALDRKEQTKSEELAQGQVKPTIDPVPAKVAAFWNAPEPWIPPWRPIESAEERAQREAAQNRGCWTG